MAWIHRARVHPAEELDRPQHGAEVNFGTTAGDTLTVYTTRCDTLFGATYMVVSPEHAMVREWLEKGLLKNADAVTAIRQRLPQERF